jgi:hypothetical protein
MTWILNNTAVTIFNLIIKIVFNFFISVDVGEVKSDESDRQRVVT